MIKLISTTALAAVIGVAAQAATLTFDNFTANDGNAYANGEVSQVVGMENGEPVRKPLDEHMPTVTFVSDDEAGTITITIDEPGADTQTAPQATSGLNGLFFDFGGLALTDSLVSTNAVSPVEILSEDSMGAGYEFGGETPNTFDILAAFQDEFVPDESRGPLQIVLDTTVNGDFLTASQYLEEVTQVGLRFQNSPTNSRDGYYQNMNANDMNMAPVPVPAGLPLALTGLAALGYVARRRKA